MTVSLFSAGPLLRRPPGGGAGLLALRASHPSACSQPWPLRGSQVVCGAASRSVSGGRPRGTPDSQSLHCLTAWSVLCRLVLSSLLGSDSNKYLEWAMQGQQG